MYNQKFGITNIAHNLYPHIHRIIALRDIGAEVHMGDLGGFVADESNLLYEPGDNSWVFGDAVAAGLSIVAQDSRLDCCRQRARVRQRRRTGFTGNRQSACVGWQQHSLRYGTGRRSDGR